MNIFHCLLDMKNFFDIFFNKIELLELIEK